MDTQSFDNDTAVLIYYANTYNGEVSSNSFSYGTINSNISGPINVINHLPTVEQWNNISLKKTIRPILSCSDSNCTTMSSSTTGGDLPSAFSYENNVARLITAKEIYNGCYDGRTSLGNRAGLYRKCRFLFENTGYTNDNWIEAFWLENPSESNSSFVMTINSKERRIYYSNPGFSIGIRPAIEINKNRIG